MKSNVCKDKDIYEYIYNFMQFRIQAVRTKATGENKILWHINSAS